MIIDRTRRASASLLVLASLAFAQGVPLRDTSAQLTGWPPARSVEIPVGPDTIRSTTSVAGPVLTRKTDRNSDPGCARECIQSAAMAFGGVLLAGTGVAYWMHFSEASAYLTRHGVNSIGFPVLATVVIPVGVVMAGFGGLGFIACFGSGETAD